MEITTKELEMKVEALEQQYEELASQIDSGRWGHEESEALGQIAEKLEKAYNEAGTPEIDRIVL